MVSSANLQSGQLQNTSDFFMEAARSNLKFTRQVFSIGLNEEVGSSVFDDLWGAGNNQVEATVGEQWEVVSDSADDTIAGAGARILFLEYLDDEYINRTLVPIVMNGTTPVTLAPTDSFRAIVLVVVQGGSSKENIGNITLRVKDGGATRSFMPAGFGLSADGKFTAHATETAYLILREFNIGRNTSAKLRIKSSLGELALTNSFITTGYVDIFETETSLQFKMPIPYQPKSDIKTQAKTASGTSSVVSVLQFLCFTDST